MRDLEQLFKGLSDRTRLRILNLLIHGELCVCDIQYVLDSSQPNVSRHLTYLKNSGLVSDRREGSRMYYRLAQTENGLSRPLFRFLSDAFKSCDALAEDLRKLRKAVANGSCTLSEWRPYSALARPRASSRT